MKKCILILSLIICLSCKNDNNDNVNRFIVEQYNSKNNFSSLLIFDFDKSDLLYFKSNHHKDVKLKTPEEFQNSGGTILNEITPIDTKIKRIVLSNEDKSILIDAINNLKEEDLKTKTGDSFYGVQINYHLLYNDKEIDFNRINDFSENLIALNKIISKILDKEEFN